MNYYELLKVKPTASDDEIRKAYLVLSKMMHPDKFDPLSQKDQWERANEFLKDLNEAYAILKDKDKRAKYDNNFKAKPHDNRSSQSSQDHKGNQSGFVKSGFAYLENLPEQINSRLKLLSEAKYPNSFTLATTDANHHKWIIGISSIILLFPVWAIYSERWTPEGALFRILLTICLATLIAYSISRIKEYASRPMNYGIFLTGLHLIKIENRKCTYFWRRDMKDIKVAHKYKNGQYNGTDVTFVFDEDSIELNYSTQGHVSRIAQYLKDSDAHIDSLIESENWGELIDENILSGMEKLTTQHLQYKPPTKSYKYWRVAVAAILLSTSMMYVGNYFVSDVYIWGVANQEHTTSSYKHYLNTSSLMFYEDRAEDSCWSVAKFDGKISSLRDYMSGERVMKYDSDAKKMIKQRYQEIKTRYLSENSDSKNPDFVAIVGYWLDRAMETGETSVTMAFESHNLIPINIEKVIKRQSGLENILPIGGAFSESENQRRTIEVFEKFKKSFASSIPTDALLIELSDTAGARKPDMFITYSVSHGNGLYYREQDEHIKESIRPFYPGVIYEWICFAFDQTRSHPYELEFTSQPAENFRLTNKGVYNDMANSAFEDLENRLTSLMTN